MNHLAKPNELGPEDPEPCNLNPKHPMKPM